MKRFRGLFKRFVRDEQGQGMTELIIVVALVALAMAWLTTALPAAMEKHFTENQKILASPL